MPITKRFWQMGFDATERDIVIPTAFILSHGNMSMVSMEKWCGQKSDHTIFFAKKVGDIFGYVNKISYLCIVKPISYTLWQQRRRVTRLKISQNILSHTLDWTR
jgi:hypothetical protein